MKIIGQLKKKRYLFFMTLLLKVATNKGSLEGKSRKFQDLLRIRYQLATRPC